MTPPAPSLLPPQGDLSGFPEIQLQAGDQVYRAHGARGPWHFGQSGGGRFDIRNVPATGTCYVASDEEVAVREVLRDEWISGSRDTVLEASVENRQVSKLVLPRQYRLADLLHDDANGYGLNREIMADPSNYPMAQEWALAFFRAGFAGIFYEPRNTLGRNRWAAALFDAVGAKDSTDGFPDAVSTKQMREAAAQAGVMVASTPTSSAGLTVVSP